MENVEKAAQKPEQDRSHILHDKLLADAQGSSALQEKEKAPTKSEHLPNFQITNSASEAEQSAVKRK